MRPESRVALALSLIAFAAFLPSNATAQETSPLDPKKMYQALRTFQLGGKRSTANNLVIHVDRAEMTFTSGIFYFSLPIGGRIYEAVFIGEGKFHADPPDNKFEKDNVMRLLNAPDMESDFKTAVLCFTDDTYQTIQSNTTPADVTLSPEAQRLATNFHSQMLKESGANIAGRLSVSLLNNESPGVFIAQFDKGHRGKFNFVLDPQSRIPTTVFRLTAGEKGVIFRYNEFVYRNELWMAFYSLQDYAIGIVPYSDVFDQVAVHRHDIDFDLSDPGKWLKYTDRMDIEVLQDNLNVIQFAINEDLGVANDVRLHDSMRLKFVNGEDGRPLDFIQEDWDCTLTIFLPKPAMRGQKFAIALRLEGKQVYTGATYSICMMPLSDSWYPRHGFYQRSSYRLVINHKKSQTTVAAGKFNGDRPSARKGLIASEWDINVPIPDIAYGIGLYRNYKKPFKGEETKVPFDYYWAVSPNGRSMAPNHDFIAAEMSNDIQYLSAQLGDFPYDILHGVYVCNLAPRADVGAVTALSTNRSIATMLFLPASAIDFRFSWGASAARLAFIAHGVARQWFGSDISIHSYRDEWLNEGFTKYFGMLYMGQRDKVHSLVDEIDTMHFFLRAAPVIQNGLGPGVVANIGPMILGHRLNTLQTLNGFQQVVVNKAALVIRMLHFLFTNPETGDDKAFFDMMKDFVQRFQGKEASTEDFLAVANEHFPATEIAKKYDLADLGWFFRQWVYSAELPSYRLEYHLEPQSDGSAILLNPA